jgi:outer membrane protein
MKRGFIFFFLLMITAMSAEAQEGSTWTLQKSIQYALENNTDIKQSTLDERLAKLLNLQNKLSQLPDVNAAGTYGKSSGRSINPATNQFVEGSYNFTGLTGTANLLVFAWLQRRNSIAATQLNEKAARAEADFMKDNISLNVTTAYLNILQARELVSINEQQINLTKTQLDQTRRSAKAGVSPELNVAQLEAQLSVDSANLIDATADYENNILKMKALLNLELTSIYVPVSPPSDISDMLGNLSLSIDDVYARARNEMGNMRSSEMKLTAARKNLWSAKGGLLPQLGAFYQLGTNYTSLSRNYVPTGSNNILVSGTYVDVNGNQYPIYQNTPIYNVVATPFDDQLRNNLRQTVGLNLTVPIFNGWRGMGNVQRARILVQRRELEKQSSEQKLRQDISIAFNEAKSALQKYNAAQKATDAAQKAQQLVQKRYGLGLANMVENLSIQNNLFNAQSRLLSSKYELILKCKVIDYYMGKDLSF